MYFVHEARFLA